MTRIPKESIPPDAIDMKSHITLMDKLQSVVVYNSMQSVRKKAFAVYDLYFGLFGRQPRPLSQLVMRVLQNANHSGLIGHAIGKLKNAILDEMKNVDGQNYISGPLIHKLVLMFCKLSNGAETDLLEVSDEVMASLNFLICLLLRDSSDNQLGLWSLVKDLQAGFLQPLEAGLGMSKAHYRYCWMIFNC